MNYHSGKVNSQPFRRLWVALALVAFCAVAVRAERLRVATYNIKFFSIRHSPCGRLPVEDVRTQGKRLEKLREVIRLLDAQVT